MVSMHPYCSTVAAMGRMDTHTHLRMDDKDQGKGKEEGEHPVLHGGHGWVAMAQG